MNYFKQILVYAKPYKIHAFLNILFNVFYALFSALSFMALIPMLDILFKTDAVKPSIKPIYTGISGIKDYYKDYMAFQVNEYAQRHQHPLLCSMEEV